MTTKKTTKPVAKNSLPDGVLKSDLEYRSGSWSAIQRTYAFEGHELITFDLWHVVGFGWVIPTLLISKTRRTGIQDRTYAVKVDGGGTCRVGKGPHVDETVKVYVKRSRLAALQKFLDLRTAGQVKAGTIRDRISSRRAEGTLHRAAGHHSWRWGTL